jgi:uncharacterized protein (TIGR01619 family)
MTDRWGFYFASVDGKPTSFNVNLGLIDTAPDTGRPWMGKFSVRMAETTEHGFPTAAEYERLNGLEDTLLAKLHDGAEAMFVGQITSAGTRALIFYAPDGDRLRSALDEASQAYPDFDILPSQVDLDADWSYYLKTLYPGQEDLQSIENRDASANLKRYGDDLSQPRPVTHWAYFDLQLNREAFVAEMEALGFAHEATEDPESARPYGVRLERVDHVDFRSIDRVTHPIFRSANAHHGEYDGWECPVIVAEPALV